MLDREQAATARLNGQISWYDKRSKSNQLKYKILKVITMGVTGMVPVLAAFSVSSPVVGIFGFAALFCEGLQQLNQYHANWISYRSTCEALKHERHLYDAQAGHYRETEDPVGLLAEQTESLVSVEHAKWVSKRHEAEKHEPADARSPTR